MAGVCILCRYDGLSRCTGERWEEQAECSYAEKSIRRDCCLWMRPSGTCSHPEVNRIMKDRR